MTLEEYIAASKAIIDTWPEWKKGSLGSVQPDSGGSILPPPIAETVEGKYPIIGTMGNPSLPKPDKVGLWYDEPGLLNLCRDRLPADWKPCFEVVCSDAEAHPGILAWSEVDP